MLKVDEQKINEILNRGVENIYPDREELEKVLLSGKRLRIYNGIDPTGKLHIGHGVVLLKLCQLQDLGHEIILLIGDFTARIGDPSGKDTVRKPLSGKEIKNNMKDYKKHASKILDFSKVKIKYNSQWLKKLKFEDILKLSSLFTVQQMIQRDMFQRRLEKDMPISLQEFMYPLMQGYDSVAMDVDMEIGGNDQTFNMLAGRTLMKKMKNKDKFVLTTKLLVDPTGKKMGKTEGNMINLNESPVNMYGKIMNWPDSLISLGFELCTRVPLEEIKEIKEMLNPRDQKARLAREIVKIFHGEKEAEKSAQEFNKIFRDRELPSEMPVFEIPKGYPKKNCPVLDLLCDSGLAPSKTEAKRLVEGGAVVVKNGESENKITDWKDQINLEDGMVLKVGSRKFVKVKLK